MNDIFADLVGRGSEGDISSQNEPIWDWNVFRKYLRLCLSNLDLYKLDEFKSWCIVRAIPLWGINPQLMESTADLSKSHINPFLESNKEVRWRSCLLHEKDYYNEHDTFQQHVWFDGIQSNITVAIHFLHWLLLYQFGIDPKDLDFILEFGGGVGHIPKLVRKLGFNGKYGIFDFPEFSVIQQFYNNMEIAVINHPELIDLFLGDGGNGLFYSTWGFSEAPLDLRKRIEQNLLCYKYCCILYQDKFLDIDNVKYFDGFVTRNSDFDWTRVDFENYMNYEDNTYLLGVRKW